MTTGSGGYADSKKVTAKAKLNVVKNTLLAFATPIHQVVYPNVAEFNAELASRILALRTQSPGEVRSNVGGWHSDNKLLQNLGEPYGTRLARMFVECVHAAMGALVDIVEPLPSKVSLDAWANVNERGDRNVAHIHGGGVPGAGSITSPPRGVPGVWGILELPWAGNSFSPTRAPRP